MTKPWKPTDSQWRLIEEVARFPVRNFQNIGIQQVASLKALSKRGFLRLRYVNSRAWDAVITPAGKQLLETDR